MRQWLYFDSLKRLSEVFIEHNIEVHDWPEYVHCYTVEVKQSQLGQIRRATGCKFELEHKWVSEWGDEEAIYVTLKIEKIPGVKLRYKTDLPPQHKKCRVETVHHEAYTSRELVCRVS